MSTQTTELAVFTKPADLQAFLQRGRSAIEMALPKHLNPDRMLRLALTAFSTTPALRKCTGQSILASIVVASQLGLEPGVTGQAYLIPYGNTCTLVPGWQGLVGLLNNSGRATAWTGCIYYGDTVRYRKGSTSELDITPGENDGDADHITHFFACGRINNAEIPVIEVWSADRVKRHRDRHNKVGARHYSFQHWEMYGRKVVLLQVLKYMPRSIELADAITATDASEVGHAVQVENGIVIDTGITIHGEEPVAPIFAPAENKPRVDEAPAAHPNEPPPEHPPAETDPLKAVGALLSANGVSEHALMDYLVKAGLAKKTQCLGDLSNKKLVDIAASFASFAAELERDATTEAR